MIDKIIKELHCSVTSYFGEIFTTFLSSNCRISLIWRLAERSRECGLTQFVILWLQSCQMLRLSVKSPKIGLKQLISLDEFAQELRLVENACIGSMHSF